MRKVAARAPPIQISGAFCRVHAAGRGGAARCRPPGGRGTLPGKKNPAGRGVICRLLVWRTVLVFVRYYEVSDEFKDSFQVRALLESARLLASFPRVTSPLLPVI